MDPWQKESLGLKVGDWIIWRGVAVEVEGQALSPGMKGKVVSLHDGFHMDLGEGFVPPKAVVEFESGMRIMVDGGMKWEKAT